MFLLSCTIVITGMGFLLTDSDPAWSTAHLIWFIILASQGFVIVLYFIRKMEWLEGDFFLFHICDFYDAMDEGVKEGNADAADAERLKNGEVEQGPLGDM